MRKRKYRDRGADGLAMWGRSEREIKDDFEIFSLGNWLSALAIY